MSGPLTGVRILEIASLAPAPFGCMMMADLGADVIRVDRLTPGGGIPSPPGPLDRGRRTVALDLKSPAGIEAVLALAGAADVLVEGFRPGVAERLGIGPDDLAAINPRLVYARMTGWGQDGPLAPRAGHDINYIAVAGALEPIGRAGESPVPPLNIVGDFAGGGMLMAFGILAALLERERSGRGQVVDAAMVDGAALLTSFLHGLHAAGIWQETRGTNVLDGAASFYDSYLCADGRYVAVGCVEPQFFGQLVSVLEIDDSELPHQLDPGGWPAWKKLLADAFVQRPRDEWTALFADSDACVSPVLTPWEAHLHPHNAARGTFVEVDGLVQPAPAPRFGRTHADHPRPMDAGGRDVATTLGSWGLADDRVRSLLASGAVA